MQYRQTGRLVTLTTPLGEDVLLLEGFTGQEGISQLFHFTLYLLSEDPAISFEAIVGKPATIHIDTENGLRHINGIISQFSQGFTDGSLFRYHAVLVPWLWKLTRRVNSRIFQNKTVPDIIERIFQELGFSDFRMQLAGNYPTRAYCVQYRESDFNFVSRLMEEEGIFYFFDHEDNRHTLILGDSSHVHSPITGQSSLPYAPAGGPRDGYSVTSWLQEQEVRSAEYTLRDYNFETPSTDLTVNTPTILTVGLDDRLEIYDYEGKYLKRAEGERYVKLRMQAEEAPHTRILAASDCPGLIPGHLFTLTHHFRDEFNRAYLLTVVNHEGASNLRQGSVGASYSNSFTCIPEGTLFRPPRLTPKPMIRGPQTALVVGKQGEEIWTDKYGRVKVQFHWDREGELDENSSCWIRVAQSWAGKRWGTLFIPRIGQEVIVQFLEGDPDQPIITGCVYNAEMMPPYELPNEQTKSTIKTLSSKGGGGFNEIRFEDHKGSEQIFIHAERDQDNRVKHDSLEWVGQDRHLIIQRDQLELVQGDKHLTVKGDHNEQVDGTVSLKAGMDLQEKVGMKHALDAGMEIHLKAGMNVVIEAGLSITLKAGAAFIVVGPAGVTVSGIPILLNSGGAAGSGSGSSPETPQQPREADTAEAGALPERRQAPAPPTPASEPVAASLVQAQVLQQAAQLGVPFCEKCAAMASVLGAL
ncbi:MAG TPA: type VI secretion system tip protein TssI/VgrG [Alphaproteobacteria bacterium]|nr:type VI secretion system tip protein TssI/VgrG [Alphaproteobacteria bacterium]